MQAVHLVAGRSRPHRVAAFLTALVLAAAACSDSEPDIAADPTPSTTAEMADMAGDDGAADAVGGHDDGHSHGTSMEVADGVPVPTIAIEVSEDPVEGWNLRVRTTDFEIVPENVSTAHVDGEGHMHLYIDGNKVTRVYGQWHHIGALAPGEHEVRVELSSNNHSALSVGGDIIDATAVIVASDADGHATGHDHVEAREAVEPYPSLSIELVDDPAGGWSLHAMPSNFRLAPENASGDHVDGEGHMHLYVNGDKAARLYEAWAQMPPLPAGTHEIRVDLQSNDHAPLTVDGVAIDAAVMLEVSADEATMAPGPANGDDTGDGHGDDGGHAAAGAPTPYDAAVADAAQTISVEVIDGAPVGGPRRVEVELGSVVAVMVSSDVSEDVHVHGYDILRAVAPGAAAHFAFTAEIPGVFEVEFERSGRLLLQLEIS